MTADIHDGDHVARYCSPRNIDANGKPNAKAFILRDIDKCCLSVNWLECFEKKNIADNIPHARNELRKHHKNLKRDGRLVVLNVGVVKRAVKTANEVGITIRKDPHDGYRSHACIGGYSSNNYLVAITLSEIAGESDMYPVV